MQPTRQALIYPAQKSALTLRAISCKDFDQLS